MEGDCLSWDYLLVPVGLCVLGIYHIWLLIAVLRNPTKTVIGLNSAVRKQWVFSMMASNRYFAHASFLATLPTGKDKTDYIEYVSTTVNRGSYFWSLGLRAFYLSIPLFLWIFGAIPMFVCCCITTNALYFLDTTTSFTQLIHSQSLKEEGRTNDVESIGQSSANSGFEDFHIRGPLLNDYDSVSAANVAR
ncbi:uncharacterized protein Pyn_18551 [Prunus yedoensis var. nudiflora]|uniref:Uncharacterized protein n=1 Tax=Prunus yedoensis var. nudiflora TaxID=2094558 RepID=A0A314ZEM0_PRUYE|nr:uncharacterized protein Pyn_18551 [Prunus yedoensis var. nudiflora]